MASKLGKVIANFEVQLSTKLSVGGTTATLSSILDKDGNTIPNGRYFLTIDPDNSKKEHFSCVITGTAVTQLKTINRTTITETAGALREHKVGAKVIITDFAVLAKIQQILDGLETLNASAPLYYDAVPTLTSPEQLATVQYVLDVATGGTVSFDTQIISSQTAGETVAVNEIAYLKESDQKWYKSSALTLATYDQVQIGFIKTAGVVNDPIQVAILGPVSGFSGLTAGSKYYISDTSGAVSATPGTNKVYIGVALSTSSILLNKSIYDLPKSSEKDALAGGGDFGTPSSSNKFVTESFLTNSPIPDGTDGDVTISGTTTLTRDMYYNDLVVNGTLNTAGYRVFVKGNLTGNGTIQNNGNNGSGATAGAATVGYFSNVAGSNGGNGGSGSGVAGNNGANTSNQTNLLVTTASSAGGNGGSQAGAGGGTAGTSGTRTASLTKIGIVKSYTINGLDITAAGSTVKFLPSMGGLGGGGGGGGNNVGGNGSGGNGGGGGASGGIVAIFVNSFGGSVSINAIGGNGGNGTNASGSIGGGGSGGAGGNGGYILVVYNTKSWTGAYNVSGGTGGSVGTPTGSGGAGTAGAAGASGTTNEISMSNLI